MKTLYLSVLLLALLLPSCSESQPSTAPPLNVVLIFVDDLGYGDVGVYGATAYETPYLDQMAAEGVHFTNFYASQPVCSASRAALLTGTYSNRIGIHGALGPSNTHGIHEDEVTLGELFQSQGYTTAAFGKWHLGHHTPFLPTRNGFDTFYGIPYSNDMWPYHPENPENWGDLPTFDMETIVGYNTDQSRFTTDFTTRSISFMEEAVSTNTPFFLYLAHPMPHVPLFVAEEREGHSGAGLYGDVIKEIDWSAGQVLNTIERLGIEDNTLVIFSSDNGPWLSYGNHAGSTAGLREGKGTTWEGGVRVPFIARWPGTLPEGLEVSTPAMTIDVFPTLAELVEAPLPDLPIDGRSIWSLMTGEHSDPVQEAYYFYYHRNQLQSLRSGKWKMFFPHRYRTMEGQAPGKDGMPGKYTHYELDSVELYDLEADPNETTNVADQFPEIIERLSALADSARNDMGDSLTGIEGKNTREPGKIEAD